MKYKAQIARLAKMAGKIMGLSSPPMTPQAIFEQAVVRQARNIVSDPLHVLNSEYVLMRTGRRYRMPKCRYNRYKHSFVPLSIKFLNEN